MKSKLLIPAWLALFASFGLCGVVTAADSQPEWELTTIDRNPVDISNNPKVAEIANIVITGKNSVTYNYHYKGRDPFQVRFAWQDPLPTHAKVGDTLVIPFGARLVSGKGSMVMSMEHKTFDGGPEVGEGRVLTIEAVGAGISGRDGKEYHDDKEFKYKLAATDGDIVIRGYVNNRGDDGHWRVISYTYNRIDHPRSDSAQSDGAGAAGSFAGKYDTTLGPLVVREKDGWASGLIPNSQMAFNGRIDGNTLVGKYRDNNGTGSIRIKLTGGQPAISGAVTPDGVSGSGTNFSGTVVKAGDPAVDPAQPAKSNGLAFQAPELWVRPGDTVQAPIWLLNGNGLGAINVQLHYDPQVLQALPDQIKGNLTEEGIAIKINPTPADEPGTVKVGFATKNGLEAPGVGTVNVTKFKVIGRAGDKSPLRLETTTLNMADETKVAAQVIDGAVYVVSNPMTGVAPGTPPPLPPPPTPFTGSSSNSGGGRNGSGTGSGSGSGNGNSNGNGSGGGNGNGSGTGGGGVQPPAQPPVPPQTFEDADSALAMSVGLIPTDLRYDVAGETAGSAPDGKVTAHDAQVIAKRAAQAARRGNQQ